MTFNPNIPQAGDRPSGSQGQLLTNFAALNTVFAVDHLAFNAVDGGEHQQVTLNSVVGDPGLADPKCSLYIKTIAGDSELSFEKYDNTAAANLVQQMTNLAITTVGTNNGITTPWGLIINWGTYTSAVAASVAVAFAVPYVGVPIVTLGREDNVIPTTKYISYATGSVTNAGFTAVASGVAFTGSYIAIGV